MGEACHVSGLTPWGVEPAQQISSEVEISRQRLGFMHFQNIFCSLADAEVFTCSVCSWNLTQRERGSWTVHIKHRVSLISTGMWVVGFFLPYSEEVQGVLRVWQTGDPCPASRRVCWGGAGWRLECLSMTPSAKTESLGWWGAGSGTQKVAALPGAGRNLCSCPCLRTFFCIYYEQLLAETQHEGITFRFNPS